MKISNSIKEIAVWLAYSVFFSLYALFPIYLELIWDDDFVRQWRPIILLTMYLSGGGVFVWKKSNLLS